MWVDDSPRVSCVTPLARVRGRSVTTVEGLGDSTMSEWATAMCATGGSQCGFCTPGIVMRLEAVRRKDAGLTVEQVDQAMLAHLCRCTGWQTIEEAALCVGATPTVERDVARAEERARLEGGVAQSVRPQVSLGLAGFADDTAPADALVAVRGADGEWVVAETLTAARRLAGKVQGRRTTEPLSWPVDLPEGDWDRVLQTTWVEPAYLEPDASWCVPGGEPVTPLANGGAFGAKGSTEVGVVARRLADLHGRPVRVLYSREDVVRLGPKRPPMAIGMRADGTGVVRVARTAGIAEAIASVAPGLEVIEVDVVGPPTSAALRGAGWAEAAAVIASLAGSEEILSRSGATASASIDGNGKVTVRVTAGTVLDAVVLRSYCIGAAHMALGWVRSEAINVDASGQAHDLTIRSFGALRAVDTPYIEVEIIETDRPPVNGSDAVFAAVAAAAWRREGHPARWPVNRNV